MATAFVGLIGKIRELREATRERIGPGISQKDADEAAQAVAGLSRAYAAHHDAVKNLAEGEITLGEKTKRIIENLREELRLRNELANSEKNVKLAEVGEKEAREEMTPAQAIEARRKIEDEYAMRSLDSGISMEDAAFNLKKA